MIHTLRIDSHCIESLICGGKRSVILENNNDYQKGDFLRLSDSAPLTDKFSFKITHVYSGPGIKENYVVLSLEYIQSIESKVDNGNKHKIF